MKTSKARRRQLQDQVRAESRAREIVKSRGWQCRHLFCHAQRIASGQRDSSDKVLRVEIQADPIVFSCLLDIEIKLGVFANAAEIKDLCWFFFYGGVAALFAERYCTCLSPS